jgi:tRNA (guanine-N7-)-methyltransferase
MLEVLEAQPLLENEHGPGHYADRAGARVETRFEARGARLGHAVRELSYLRKS